MIHTFDIFVDPIFKVADDRLFRPMLYGYVVKAPSSLAFAGVIADSGPSPSRPSSRSPAWAQHMRFSGKLAMCITSSRRALHRGDLRRARYWVHAGVRWSDRLKRI